MYGAHLERPWSSGRTRRQPRWTLARSLPLSSLDSMAIDTDHIARRIMGRLGARCSSTREGFYADRDCCNRPDLRLAASGRHTFWEYPPARGLRPLGTLGCVLRTAVRRVVVVHRRCASRSGRQRTHCAGNQRNVDFGVVCNRHQIAQLERGFLAAAGTLRGDRLAAKSQAAGVATVRQGEPHGRS
jgi:hypothetical protein